jgi:DNA-binding transcriptional LysR family regulator
MLDPVWLTSFVAVAETLNFTAAAQRLHLRQPTVSEHVRKLEAACGRRLFTRDTHSVALTDHGEAMIGFAASILETNARAMRHFSDDELHGRIRFGVSEDVVLRGLPQALRQFTQDHPRVELELTVGLSEAMRERLNSGALDLVFLKRRVGETHGDLVWREPLVWLAAPDFRLDRQLPAPLIVLTPPSLTRSAALAALEARGRGWRIACTSGSQSGVHAAVFAGLGVAPHARSLAPEGLVEVPRTLLPALGDIEFAVIGGRAARSGPAQALAAMIQISGVLLRNRGSRARSAGFES